MRRNIVPAMVVMMVTHVVAMSCLAATKIAREDLGRGVKLTILVDKVMQPQADWVTEEWMVKEAAEAGFNVFSPRRGGDRMDEVRQVTEWCDKYGIYHMPWMRGTLGVGAGADAEGKRLVWANGNEQPLWSPNSDELWSWMTDLIVEYAQISTEMPNLMGVFLDYENYAPGKQGNCYSLSYDDVIMGKFAQAQGIELPPLDRAQRKGWLDERGLHDEFSEFQINHWRERCKVLREAVDKINPKFQFCVYPAPGTLLMIEAIYPEWATEEAPLILADPRTYGRRTRFVPQEKALERNRDILEQGMQIAREAGIPFIYAGGIDPAVRGADPEFSGKNAVMISEITDGYWIFYEGPTYTEADHAAYWKWFTWANKAIAEGRFDAQHERRETPDEWAFPMLAPAGAKPGLAAPEGTGQPVEYPPVRLRRANILLVAGKAAQPFKVVLQHHRVSNYTGDIEWDIRTLQWDSVAAGTIPHGERGTVTFVPENDGLYPIIVSAGRCAYSVASSNVPLALYAGDGLSIIGGAERLYFNVPSNVDEFTLAARGAGAETVRVDVHDPGGNQVATGQTSLKAEEAKITVPTGENAGKTWSLAIGKADEGVLEDSAITLDSKLPPALSLAPQHVFGLGREG